MVPAAESASPDCVLAVWLEFVMPQTPASSPLSEEVLYQWGVEGRMPSMHPSSVSLANNSASIYNGGQVRQMAV